MKTILIVDDDTHINDLLFEILTKAGYKVLRAWSGTEAKMIIENNTPNLILLDLMLPGISGEELVPQFKEIPIIILS
ncbi:MAG: response regulator transcription factor, partial [Acutalibacteraceae bacterium]